MLRFIFPHAFLALVPLISYSQQEIENGTISPYWDFYASNYLNGPSLGKGNTGLASESGISGVNLNPATLNIQKKYQVNFQYAYRTSQHWLPSLNFPDLYLKHQLFSAFAAFGYRINKDFQTGFVYSNPTSMRLSLGTIIRTNEFGQTLDSTDSYLDYIIHSFSVPLVYATNKYSLGMTLSYTIYRSSFYGEITTPENPEGYVGELSENYGRFNAQIGARISPVQNLSFGASVTPGFNMNTSSDSYFRVVAKFPWKIGVGLEYAIPAASIKLSADYNYAHTSVLTTLRDRHDINLGAEYMLNRRWTLRGGFFTLLDYRNKEVNWLDPVEQYDQYFFTAGAGYKSKFFEIDGSIMDSHISTGIIKNTYLHASMSYNF